MMRLKTPKLDRESVRHLTDTHPAQLTPEAIDGCQEELFENPMIRRNPTRRLRPNSFFLPRGRSILFEVLYYAATTPPSQRRAEKGYSECRVPRCGELNQEMKRNFVWYRRTPRGGLKGQAAGFTMSSSRYG